MIPSSFAVTGASTGIGRATVAELVRAGHHVWATVRKEEDAASLQREHGEAVSVLRLDLTDEDSIRAARARARRARPDFDDRFDRRSDRGSHARPLPRLEIRPRRPH